MSILPSELRLEQLIPVIGLTAESHFCRKFTPSFPPEVGKKIYYYRYQDVEESSYHE